MAFSIHLIARRNSIQGVDIINSSNSIVGTIYDWRQDIQYYFSLKSVNDSLLKENSALRTQLSIEGSIDTFQDVTASIPIIGIDSAALKPLMTDTAETLDSNFRKSSIRKVVRYASHQYIPARVINNSIADGNINFITINRGAKDGIKPRMAVVTSNGIVGRVVNVSDNYSVIRSVLSKGINYNAKLIDGTTSSIVWDEGSTNSVTMVKIPKVTDVQLGDTVYTSGFSIFPEQIIIGTVAEIEQDKKSSALNLRILLSTNFRKLKYVYVVNNDMGTEKEELEKTAKEAHKEN